MKKKEKEKKYMIEIKIKIMIFEIVKWKKRKIIMKRRNKKWKIKW